MAHGVRFETKFKNTAGNQYAVQLLQKNYTGPARNILLAGNPIRHSWQTDEPKAPVKGSSITLTLLNPGDERILTTYDADIQLQYFVMTGVSWIFITAPDFIPVIGEPFAITGHPSPGADGMYTPQAVIVLGADSYRVELPNGTLTTSSSNSAATVTTDESQALPISIFKSSNDDEWKIRLFREPSPLSVKLFEGFLVQDDCSEPMVDYTHEISLSFTDNLGLLKDISLSANVPDFGGFPATANMTFDAPTGDCFIYLYNTDFIPEVGVPFTIERHIDGNGNGTFTPITVASSSDRGWIIQVADLSFIDVEAWPIIITGSATINLYNKNTLLNLIRVCLYNTGLELNTLVYANIFETTHNIFDSFLAQTYIETTSFIKGGEFIDCYDVLTKILSRWHLTLFQSLGRWNIIRWDEARYGATPFFLYDTDLIMQQTGTFDNFFATGFKEDTYPETGLMRSYFRPYNYVKETFNYVQPESLIINSNLQMLGDFSSTETISGIQYDYYELPEASRWQHFNTDISKIVVKTDVSTGSEIDRYIFQTKIDPAVINAIPAHPNVQLNDVQVSKDSVMEFKIRIKADAATGGDDLQWYFGVFLLDTATGAYWRLFAGGEWLQVFSAFGGDFPSDFVNIAAADAETYFDYQSSYHSATLKVPRFPVSGVLRIRVYGNNTNNPSYANVNAIWKDISLIIIQSINDNTKIIGHIHNNSQTETIKNNSDDEIYLDDSPKSTIAGTLYTVNHTGNLVQVKTTNWYRLTNNTELLRLGQITTLEQLFWRRASRTKQDGTFYGITNGTFDISMLSILKNVAFNDLNFIFGMLEIDYKNNNFSGTQWELYADGEADSDLINTYTFTYLYDSK